MKNYTDKLETETPSSIVKATAALGETLVAEIIADTEKQNERDAAWMAEKEGRYASGICIDAVLEHAVSYGVETFAQWEATQQWEVYYDLYKSYKGIRPRWTKWSDHTAQEWSDHCDALGCERIAEGAY